jgi:hypothetical protein
MNIDIKQIEEAIDHLGEVACNLGLQVPKITFEISLCSCIWRLCARAR